MATPARTRVQRMDALAKGDAIRLQRAQLKRDLKAGRASIVDALLDPPDWLHNAKVFDLLLAVPKYGRVKGSRVLGEVRISHVKTVRGLSDRQRLELLRRFGATGAQLESFARYPSRSLPASSPARTGQRRLPRSNAGQGRPPSSAPTRFQLAVLHLACEHGTAGDAYIDDIAFALETSTNGVGMARHALHRLGLLDDFGAPTRTGRALAAETSTTPPAPAPAAYAA